MNQTITVDMQSARTLATELENLEKIKKALLSVLPLQLLREGSELWWEKATQEGFDDIKEGRVRKFGSVDELAKHFGL